jgi:AcrR family transcriptional regulator
MEVQERILHKSHELFMRYGLRTISMDEIATQLGISKKTIYQFYADKDALVEAVVNLEICENEKECICFKEQSHNAIHEVFLAMDKVQEMLKGMNPALLYELQKYHPKAFLLFNNHKQGFFYEVNKQNILRGIAEEIYRSDVDADILARYRIACVFLVFEPSLFPNHHQNIYKVLWQTTEHYLYGLATPKGKKLIEKYKNQRINNSI